MTVRDVSTPIKSESGPALLSPDRCHRYTLTRVWDERLPVAAWIGLNPSTADESKLDPTLRRVLRFSSDWGFGSFVMLNLFSFRATDPRVMKARGERANTSYNDEHIVNEASAADLVVCAWGAHGSHRNRSTEVLRMLDRAGVQPHYLELTGAGQPKHPLYLSSELRPKPLLVSAS